MKSMVTEKHHFDKREELILINNFSEILDYQDFDARINFHGFRSENSTKLTMFSLEFLLEEIQPVTLEKYEI